jgi:hypothetical protein
VAIKVKSQDWHYPYPDPESSKICPLKMGKLTKDCNAKCQGEETIQAEHAEGIETCG